MAYKHKKKRTVYPTDNKLFSLLGKTLVDFCRANYPGAIRQLAKDCQHPQFYNGKHIPISFFTKLQNVDLLKEYPKVHNIAYLFAIMGVNIWDVITVRSSEEVAEIMKIQKKKAGGRTRKIKLTKREKLRIENEARKDKLRALELRGVDVKDPKFKLSEDYKIATTT